MCVNICLTLFWYLGGYLSRMYSGIFFFIMKHQETQEWMINCR